MNIFTQFIAISNFNVIRNPFDISLVVVDSNGRRRVGKYGVMNIYEGDTVYKLIDGNYMYQIATEFGCLDAEWFPTSVSIVVAAAVNMEMAEKDNGLNGYKHFISKSFMFDSLLTDNAVDDFIVGEQFDLKGYYDHLCRVHKENGTMDVMLSNSSWRY